MKKSKLSPLVMTILLTLNLNVFAGTEEQVNQEFTSDVKQAQGEDDSSCEVQNKLKFKKVLIFLGKSVIGHIMMPASRASFYANIDAGQVFHNPKDYDLAWKKKTHKPQPDFSKPFQHEDGRMFRPVTDPNYKNERFTPRYDEHGNFEGVNYNPEFFSNTNGYGFSPKDVVELMMYLAKFPGAYGEIILFHPFLGAAGLFRGIKSIYKYKKGKENGGILHIPFVNNPPCIRLNDSVQF